MRPFFKLIIEAIEEFLSRKLALSSFAAFVKHFSEFKPAKHQELLIKSLQKVSKNNISRLMIFMPPGHAKSLYASVLFPAYYLAKNPKHSIIVASHTSNLAEQFAKKTRNIIMSNEFKLFFEPLLAEGSKAATKWQTVDGGEYYALGVGAAVTGKRADLAIIDDPIKGIFEADSPQAREKLWQWYLSDLRTRLKPNAKIIIIQTRWHEDDLSGRILEGESKLLEKEGWEVLNFPALAIEDEKTGLKRKKGEALWEEAYSRKMLERERSMQPPRIWHALYQQQPILETGSYFKAEWLKRFDLDQANLSRLKIYGASDYAVTDGGGDYTVHGVFGVDHEDNLYVLDWWKGQTSSDIWIEIFLDMMKKWSTIFWIEESGQINKSLGPFINKRQRERKIYGRRLQMNSSASKEMRARSFQARLAMGKVFFPQHSDWVKDLLDEVLHFPNVKHDDQVDVLSLMGRGLDKTMSGESIDHHPKQLEKSQIVLSSLVKSHFVKQKRLQKS